jgi:hypothetical protein
MSNQSWCKKVINLIAYTQMDSQILPVNPLFSFAELNATTNQNMLVFGYACDQVWQMGVNLSAGE